MRHGGATMADMALVPPPCPALPQGGSSAIMAPEPPPGGDHFTVPVSEWEAGNGILGGTRFPGGKRYENPISAYDT